MNQINKDIKLVAQVRYATSILGCGYRWRIIDANSEDNNVVASSMLTLYPTKELAESVAKERLRLLRNIDSEWQDVAE